MANDIFDENGYARIKSRKSNIGLIHITRKTKSPSCDELSKQDDITEFNVNELLTNEKLSNSKKIKKKHKKKSKKKKIKKYKEMLCENISEASNDNGNVLAELLKNSESLIVANGTLRIYDENTGCYVNCDQTDVATKLRSLVGKGDRLKLKIREYKEAYQQLMICKEIMSDETFFENKPFVNCLNGVVDVENEKLLKHSSEYKFKDCIASNYDENAKCPQFMKYVDYITNGDKELKELLQVIMGYCLSHYNNAKTVFLLYGIPHTGKSVLCRVLEEIAGKKNTSHVDLGYFNKPEYVAELVDAVINIAPDLTNVPLKDVGFFKMLTSHDDTSVVRSLYHNPQEIQGGTKMIFASNHLLNFDSCLSSEDIEATFNRIIYFPFMNVAITKSNEDKYMSEKLIEERDGIFVWSMKGLKKYIENNEIFPVSKKSKKIKLKNISMYCSEKAFVEQSLKFENDSYESSQSINAAYKAFCENIGVKPGNIKSFLKNHYGLNTVKKRIDKMGNLTSYGNPIAVFKGVKLKNK